MLRPGLGKRLNPAASPENSAPKRLNPAASPENSAPKRARVESAPAPVVVRPPQNVGKASHDGKGKKDGKKGGGALGPPTSKGSKGIVIPGGKKGAGGRLGPATPGSFVRTVASSSGARPPLPGGKPVSPGVRPAAPGARLAAPTVVRTLANSAKQHVQSQGNLQASRTLAPSVGRFASSASAAARVAQAKPAQPGARPRVIASAKGLVAKGVGKLGKPGQPRVIGARTAGKGKTPVTVQPPQQVGVKVRPPVRTVPAPAKNAKAKGGSKGGSKGIPCAFFLKGSCKNGVNCPFVHGKSASANGVVKPPAQRVVTPPNHPPPGSKGASKSAAPKVVTPPPRKVAPPNRQGKGESSTASTVAPPRKGVACKYWLKGMCKNGEQCRWSHSEKAAETKWSESEAAEEEVEEFLDAVPDEMVREIRAFLDESGGQADGADVLEKFPELAKEQLSWHFQVTEDESGNFLVSAVDAEEETWQETKQETWQEENSGAEQEQDEMQGEAYEYAEGEEEEQAEEYEMQDYGEGGEEEKAEADEWSEWEQAVLEGRGSAKEEEGHAEQPQEQPQAASSNEQSVPMEVEQQSESREDSRLAQQGEQSGVSVHDEVRSPEEDPEVPGDSGSQVKAPEEHPPEAKAPIAEVREGSNDLSSKDTSTRAIGGAAIGARSAASPAPAGKGRTSKPLKGGMLVLPPARTPPPKAQEKGYEKGSGGKAGVPCRFFAKGACRNGTSCPFSHS